jgi:cytoskeleton protein RodZ
MKIEQKFSKLLGRKMVVPTKLKSQPSSSNESSSNSSDILFGKMLKGERQKSNLSLSEVSSLLRIRRYYLEAIENGNLDSIPGTTYAIGFIKSYSNYLGIDPERYINSLKNKVQNPELKNPNVFPSSAPEGKIPSVIVIFITILMTSSIFLIWNNLQKPSPTLSNKHDLINSQVKIMSAAPRQKNIDSGTSSSLQERAITRNLLRNSEKIIALKTIPDHNLRTKKYELVKPVERNNIEPADSENLITKKSKKKSSEAGPINSSSPQETTDQLQAEAKTDALKAKRLKAPNKPPVETLSNLTIQATTDSWIQIKALGSNILLSRILRTDETYTVPNRNDLLLSTGNIGALVIRINGKQIPKYAGSKRVAKDIALTKENLLKTSDNN